jgi:gluconate 2-dehydrogenase gamma chain
MNRREAIRLLAAAATLPLAPPGILAALCEARAVVGSGAPLRTLNDHQATTVRAVTEMILPRTDTPGATDVGACEFIDLILTEWYDEQERSHFLDGLAYVDERSQSLFGKEFVACSSTQRAEILIALGEQMNAAVPTVQNPRPARGDWASKANDNFYFMLRRLTLTAYFTSEAGAADALHFEVIPDRYDPCAVAQPDKEAARQK